MLITNSFRYYKNIYGTDNLDRNTNLIFSIVYFLLLIISALGFFIFLNVLSKLFLKNNFNNKIVTFTFTEYDLNIALKLQDMGIDSQCIHFGNISNQKANCIIIPHYVIFLFSIAYPYDTIIEIIKSKKDSIIRRNELRLIKLCGLLPLCRKILHNRKILINFNDHSVYDVFSNDLANSINMKTVYIQHAPVGYHFPPLFHDLNVLFSEDSLEKYQNNNKVKTFLLFDVRFLNVLKNKRTEHRDNDMENVLICINEYDDFLVIVKTAEMLHCKGYKVIIRPHPRGSMNFPQNSFYTISIGNTVWDDLNKVSIVLANESAVLLEAAYLEKYIYKCSFFSYSADYYSFLKKKLILDEYHSIENLAMAIENKVVSYNSKKIPYFIGSFDNPYDKVEYLASEIKNLLKI